MSILTRAADGVPAAGWSADQRFDDLVARRRNDLLKVAVLMTGSRHDGEDAVQDAVVAVGRSWTRVVARANEGVGYAYLRRAVVRKCIDLQRSRLPLGEVPERAADDGGLLRYESDRRFFALLAGLPPQQRAVLVLRHYLDWDDPRIGAALGISRSSVRANAMRGLHKLRQQLGSEEER